MKYKMPLDVEIPFCSWGARLWCPLISFCRALAEKSCVLVLAAVWQTCANLTSNALFISRAAEE